MVLTVSFVLSPVIGLFCHRHRRSCLRQLDTGVEASGPHDFAVRVSTIRQARCPRPPHPAPYVRDDRETPLFRERDGGGYRFDLGKSRSGIFLQMGLDRQIGDLPVGQIRLNRFSISPFCSLVRRASSQDEAWRAGYLVGDSARPALNYEFTNDVFRQPERS